MKTYTVGFVFDKDLKSVLLVWKNRPDWQAGRINGVGGHIEPGEESLDCIVREVEEETGAKTAHQDWHHFCRLRGEKHWVDFYGLVHTGEREDFRTTTDEAVEWFEVASLPEEALSNLHWLIPMAKDKILNQEFAPAVIEILHSNGA